MVMLQSLRRLSMMQRMGMLSGLIQIALWFAEVKAIRHLFPLAFAKTSKVPNPLPLTSLTLQGSHSASQAIILHYETHNREEFPVQELVYLVFFLRSDREK
jgi:hypothetical protein